MLRNVVLCLYFMVYVMRHKETYGYIKHRCLYGSSVLLLINIIFSLYFVFNN